MDWSAVFQGVGRRLIDLPTCPFQGQRHWPQLSGAVAAARPFTALAFATLVPVFGLAVNGIWSARHGAFPDRVEEG